jgi:spore germination cell wall hydrolase CwlJ-like protein
LQFGTPGRADWRALTSAALIGSAAGLGVGAVYLTAGAGLSAAPRVEAAPLAPAPVATIPAPQTAAPQPVAPQPAAFVADPSDRLGAADIVAAQTRVTRAHELDCLTQAVYFEARGESAKGQQAVATVIMNRVRNPRFPKTVCGVVYQGAAHHNGCQFSFACDGQAERVVERSAWDRARIVAARVLAGAVLRDVGSATHFHVVGVDPGWGLQMRRVSQVGLHVFYRFNPHAAPAGPGNDRSVVFTSAPAPAAAPPLRLAEAMMAPIPAGKPAVPVIVLAKPAEPRPAAKPVEPAASGLAKTDAPAPAKPQTATPS